MTENIDTSAEAVERLALSLAIADQPITAATLRALAAERDEARQAAADLTMCAKAEAEIANEMKAERDAARAQVARLRRGWLATIQVENSCNSSGTACGAKRCGCVEELEMLLREDDARAALAQEPRHD